MTLILLQLHYTASKLWTGDKKLMNELELKGHKIFISTNDLYSKYFNE